MAHSWSAKIEHKKALALEDAKFIFEQSEKFLNDVNDSHKAVVERTYTTLTVYIAILTAITGFEVERISNGIYWLEALNLSLLITISYIVIGIGSLSRNIRSTNFMAVGSPPINLFHDKIMAKNVPPEKRIIRIIMSEIERYQFRIEVNQEISQKKWHVFNLGVYWILSIPIFFLIVYLIILATQ